VSGNPTLSLPQNLHTAATPQFAVTATSDVTLSASPAVRSQAGVGYSAKVSSDTAGDTPLNIFIRTGGTLASNTGTLTGWPLGAFSFRGHDTSVETGSKAYLAVVSTENWSTTAMGTMFDFRTTANGTTTLTSRLYISDRGNILINSNSAAQPSTGTMGLFFGDGTIPATMASNTAGIYANDVSGTVNMFAINEAGVITQLTGVGAALTQTYATASTTHAAVTQLAAPAGGTGTAAGGYDTAANRNLMITSVNAAMTDIANLKNFVNEIVDQLQVRGILA
jgi:hypothetical protein